MLGYTAVTLINKDTNHILNARCIMNSCCSPLTIEWVTMTLYNRCASKLHKTTYSTSESRMAPVLLNIISCFFKSHWSDANIFYNKHKLSDIR